MGLNTQIPDIPNGFGNTFPIYFNHGNSSPLDANEYYFAWRWGLAPEIGSQFNNRAIAPNFKSVVRSIQMSWRCANTPDNTIVPFYLSVWTNQGVLKTKKKVIETPITILGGFTAHYAYGNQEDIHLDSEDQLMLSYIATWPTTNPSNLLITATATCERVL